MSDQDKIVLAELIANGKAFDKKWNIYKILTVIGSSIVTLVGICVFVGMQLGDWREWRRATTQDVTEIKAWKSNFQNANNNQRTTYNKNLKIKP